MADIIVPGPLGWIGVRRVLVIAVLPASPLVALLVYLAAAVGSRCSMAACTAWPFVAIGGILVSALGLVAAYGGNAVAQTAWVAPEGVAFGWWRPGTRWSWSELVGPVEAPRWGVVPILGRPTGRRARVVGIVTTAQARTLIGHPDFPADAVPPWVWEGLELPPPQVAPIEPPGRGPTNPARFTLREGTVRWRRHLVLFGFTAPALTAAISIMGWAATAEPGVALAVVGCSIVSWNVAYRTRRRQVWPPRAVVIVPDGLEFETVLGDGTVGGQRLTRNELVLYPTRASGRLRWYVKWDGTLRGDARAFVRIPEAAEPHVLGTGGIRAGEAVPIVYPAPVGRFPRGTAG